MKQNLPIHQMLWSVTLVALVCVSINAALLWREVRSLRTLTLRASAQPAPLVHLSDEEFARIQAFVTAVKANYSAEKEPKASVLLADDLLEKARYFHGDIGFEEWRRVRLEAEPELSRLILTRYAAGIGVEEGLSHYNDGLQMAR